MTSKIIKTVEASNIPIQDLTEVILDGDGVFDKFLTLHRKVLDREFSQGRIVGKEYSDTFTKTYTANLEMAISFLLAKEKQAYEIELQEAQIRKIDAEAAIANKQLEIAIVELSLKEKELLQKDVQLDLLRKQLALQEQKVITEKAQTEAGIAQPGSIIDTNIQALKAQIEGMDRDAKQKVAQLLVNTWNTRMNNDEALPNKENYLTDPAIGKALEDVLASAGMTVVPESGR